MDGTNRSPVDIANEALRLVERRGQPVPAPSEQERLMALARCPHCGALNFSVTGWVDLNHCSRCGRSLALRDPRMAEGFARQRLSGDRRTPPAHAATHGRRSDRRARPTIRESSTDESNSPKGRTETKEEKDNDFLRCGRRYGSFSRSMALPDGVDPEQIEAESKDGVLARPLPSERRTP